MSGDTIFPTVLTYYLIYKEAPNFMGQRVCLENLFDQTKPTNHVSEILCFTHTQQLHVRHTAAATSDKKEGKEIIF